MVEELASRCFVPLSVGGGVTCLADFQTLLGVGADKVVVNTGGIEDPALITKAAKLYGSQCVVAAIDCRKTEAGYKCYSHQGTRELDYSPDALARRFEELGAGEILVQSIDRDGSLEGYDNELNALVTGAVKIPVLACGGAGKWADFVDGFAKGGVEAVCTTCIYHFTETSIKSAKKFLSNAGLDVRTS
jgi:cyclase